MSIFDNFNKIGEALGRVVEAITRVHERQDFETNYIPDGDGGTKEVKLPTGVFHSDGSIEAVITGNEAADQIHKMEFAESAGDSAQKMVFGEVHNEQPENNLKRQEAKETKLNSHSGKEPSPPKPSQQQRIESRQNEDLASLDKGAESAVQKSYAKDTPEKTTEKETSKSITD